MQAKKMEMMEQLSDGIAHHPREYVLIAAVDGNDALQEFRADTPIDILFTAPSRRYVRIGWGFRRARRTDRHPGGSRRAIRDG